MRVALARTATSDGLDEEYIMVYGAGWQLVQEIIDSSDDDSRDRTMEYFWGLRGIDDIAHRRLTIDRDENTTFETERYYHITDPLFSTVAIIDDTNGLIERVTYDAYGKARHHPRWDVDRDGDVDGDDTTVWGNSYNEPIGQADYDPDADPDRDGHQVFSDAYALASTTAGLPSGTLSSLDYSDNRVGYAGYLRVEEAQLYCVRFRHYDDDAGRWLQRDPARFVDGTLFYEYALSNPMAFIDSSGLTPKLWTGSGINNWNGTAFSDYVASGLGVTPDVSFVSKLGTAPPYLPGGAANSAGGKYIKGTGSGKLLDFEAETFAYTRRAGEFCASECKKKTKVILLLFAPKTTTLPSVDESCCDVSVVIYFSGWDSVPNQRGLGPGDSRFARYWKKFSLNGYVESINTNLSPGHDDETPYPHHGLENYVSDSGIVSRADDLKHIPDAGALVSGAMSGDADYVFVGHSQGTNILLHVLNQVCNKKGIGASTDGAPR